MSYYQIIRDDEEHHLGVEWDEAGGMWLRVGPTVRLPLSELTRRKLVAVCQSMNEKQSHIALTKVEEDGI